MVKLASDNDLSEVLGKWKLAITMTKKLNVNIMLFPGTF